MGSSLLTILIWPHVKSLCMCKARGYGCSNTSNCGNCNIVHTIRVTSNTRAPICLEELMGQNNALTLTPINRFRMCKSQCVAFWMSGTEIKHPKNNLHVFSLQHAGHCQDLFALLSHNRISTPLPNCHAPWLLTNCTRRSHLEFSVTSLAGSQTLCVAWRDGACKRMCIRAKCKRVFREGLRGPPRNAGTDPQIGWSALSCAQFKDA